jgi:hypothetical protein
MVTKVVSTPSNDAQHCWTALLRNALTSAGFSVDPGSVSVGFTTVSWQLQDLHHKASIYNNGVQLWSPRFEIKQAGIKGFFAVDFTCDLRRRVSVYFDGFPEDHYIWLEASCGNDFCNSAFPTPPGTAIFAPVVFGGSDINLGDKLHIVLRITSTPSPSRSLHVEACNGGTSATWNLDAQVWNSVHVHPGAWVCSPFVVLCGISNSFEVVFIFEPAMADWPQWCAVRAVFPIERNLTYELSLGWKTLRNRHDPKDAISAAKVSTEQVWARRSEVATLGVACMKFSIVEFN